MMQFPDRLLETAVLIMDDDPLSRAAFCRVLRNRIRCFAPVLRPPKEFIAGLPPRDQIAVLLCNTEVALAQGGRPIDAEDLLCALALEDPAFSTIPLVLMTASMKGRSDLADRIHILGQRYRQRGIEVALLEKPFSYDELLGALAPHLPPPTDAYPAEARPLGTAVPSLRQQ